MKLRYLFASLLFFLPSFSFAQDGHTYQGMSYSMAVPLGNTQNYTNAGSFRGANYEGYHQLGPKCAIAWLAGWNVFYTKLRNETYIKDNFTITGNQYRYQNEFPILVRGLRLFGVPDGIRPFMGAGLGVIYDVRRTDIGLYSIKTDAWHFAMAPELGIIIPAGEKLMTASVRYNYGVKARDLGQVSYFSFNLGILFVP